MTGKIDIQKMLIIGLSVCAGFYQNGHVGVTWVSLLFIFRQLTYFLWESNVRSHGFLNVILLFIVMAVLLQLSFTVMWLLLLLLTSSPVTVLSQALN